MTAAVWFAAYRCGCTTLAESRPAEACPAHGAHWYASPESVHTDKPLGLLNADGVTP